MTARPRTAVKLLSLAVVVILTGCDMAADSSAMPSPAAVESAPAPVPAVAPAVSAPVTERYGIIETFQSASPGYNSAQGKINGLTKTSGKKGAVERAADTAPKAQNRLVADTRAAVASGGSATIKVTGNTDPQKQNTDNRVLAEDRARLAARDLARELGYNTKDVVVPAGESCRPGTPVCIQYTGNSSIAAGKHSGRNTTAAATFAPPPSSASKPLQPSGSDDPNPFVPGPGSIGGDPVTDPATNPETNPGAGPESPSGVETGSPESGAATDEPGESAFNPDNTSLRVTVSAPDPFVVGGKLREQLVKVVSVELFCDGRACAGADEPTLDRFVATLTLVPTSAKYVKCAYSTSTNCAFYITTSSSPEVRASGDDLFGGILRAGFFSPTATGTYVRPTLRVDDVAVRFPGVPAAAEVAVSVVWTTGEKASGGQEFSVNRRVIGSIGS